MEYLFTVDSLISLLTLTVLEIVLGIDNVIFVSIIMGRLPKDQQLKARRIWMFAGIAVRVLLLIALGWLVQQKGKPVFEIGGKGFDLASLVMLAGGLFLIYKTVKEIHHKLEGYEEGGGVKAAGSFGAAIGQIILVDMVFSFDSIITAVGIAKHVPIMIIAVIIAMFIMFLFSQKIADFISKHPTLKMLALSFLVMVGVVLIVEGWDGDKAHDLHLKNYVYFAMAFSFGVELLNMRLRRKSSKPVELHNPEERTKIN
ncbi:TerC family protein [Pinibacter aurantiacus]|uniref:TerC family protein n=1 Tax=Pinibacter aurantiacus TaxID=2851599 RepID=A0A9E2W5P9_9BACT|nr:TerC family protein [Pinibacter aurantiacus]MBV4359119.1 TerC family protein [Pinibacter aurantiacus]